MASRKVSPIITRCVLFGMDGVLTGQSVPRLFVVVAVPGVLIGLGFTVAAWPCRPC